MDRERETLLSDEAFDRLLEELERPAEVVPELRELLERPRIWAERP